VKLRISGEQLVAIVALAIVGILAVITQRAEKPQYDTYLSTDYASGGVRAWVTLLEREGVATQRFVLRPAELNSSVDTLITIAPLPFVQAAQPRTPADLGALGAWVRRGGRLVYIGRIKGLDKEERSQLALPQWLPQVGASGRMQGRLLAQTGSLSSVGTNRMIVLPPATGTEEIFDRDGDIVVRYALGKGEVVAVSDPVPFTNGAIGQAGNARLAYLIGASRRPGGRVAFDDGVLGDLVDRPWYRALPASILIALAIMAIAVVLALAGGLFPTIPPFALRDKREPTSAEFIAALAALYERTKAREDARTMLADDALAAVASSVGLSERATPKEIAARAAPRPGGDDVVRFVESLDAPVSTDEELVASARLAHTIRKEFTHGTTGDGSRSAFTGRSRTRRRR
jgi:hypothetical protein